MKPSSIWHSSTGLRWIVGGVIAVVLALAAAQKSCEAMRPPRPSESLAAAREKGVFFYSPKLTSPSVRVGQRSYRIQEVWVERRGRDEYSWLFFRRTRHMGYWLCVRLETDPDAFYLVCNGSLRLTGHLYNGYYDQIEPPLPHTVTFHAVPVEKHPLD